MFRLLQGHLQAVELQKYYTSQKINVYLPGSLRYRLHSVTKQGVISVSDWVFWRWLLDIVKDESLEIVVDVENGQQNALKYILIFISCDGSYMFRQ
jgi:hypothetical protein